MGKTRPNRAKDSQKARKAIRHAEITSTTSRTTDNAPELLSQAAANLQIGDVESALPLAQKAEALLKPKQPSTGVLPALALLGEIYVELGDPAAALAAFERATRLDPEGRVPETEGGGAEKFFWLAQLSEHGGRESIDRYEQGVAVLERQIAADDGNPGLEKEQEERRRKLASALCSMVEVWMTDLSYVSSAFPYAPSLTECSFEDDAESHCEALISRAMLVSSTPHVPTLQTLASIRLSQSRIDDAQAALTRSLELWMHLPPEHVDVPDFATRISLTRLLMEAELEDMALEVVERLVGEDDQSIEAWYLGGWCQYLISADHDEAAEGKDKKSHGDDSEDDKRALRLSSREWLRNCMKLYTLLEYEDERLHDHAAELVAELDAELGEAEIEDDEDGWEDDEDDSSVQADGMDTS